MTQRYACDFCGYEGAVVDDVPLDEVQCPMCGEQVTPMPLNSRPDEGAHDDGEF
jgi:predicted RNA-binding Zn-ribbon protein involved in translation (DUF1610 family)